LKKTVVLVLTNLAKDPVPNIRLNVAKTIFKLLPVVKNMKEISVSNS